MRTIELQAEARPLLRAIQAEVRADYVYSYPPRQAYRPVPDDALARAVQVSLARPGPLNLYFHFPFCRQICSFCNLYAVAGHADAHLGYMHTVIAETRYYAQLTGGRPVDTVYLGGGTPSLLAPELFAALFDELRQLGICDVRDVAEVAIEVAPDTVERDQFDRYAQIGINRVNLGVQSWNPVELAGIGRRHGPEVHLAALDVVQAVGFDNVCVDLIYGLDGQTDGSWESSLTEVIERAPDTVCCYPLTVRPDTGYGRRSLADTDASVQYARYDTAHAMLTAAGYDQQTHVRWALGPSGGYRQKANHWAGQDILGIGAGARGYLQHADYRNGYSARHRVRAFRGYIERVQARGHGRDSGFLVDDDERVRKQAILGLGAQPGPPVAVWFPAEAAALVEAGAAVYAGDGGLTLTATGVRHRDVVVQTFFSGRVRKAVSAHRYDE